MCPRRLRPLPSLSGWRAYLPDVQRRGSHATPGPNAKPMWLSRGRLPHVVPAQVLVVEPGLDRVFRPFNCGELSTSDLASQRNRRTRTWSSTRRPLSGRSFARRKYRLWIRCENAPQSGHGQALPADRVRTTTRSPSIVIPSTIKPAGTKLAGRNRCFIALIPSGNQHQNSPDLQQI